MGSKSKDGIVCFIPPLKNRGRCRHWIGNVVIMTALLLWETSDIFIKHRDVMSRDLAVEILVSLWNLKVVLATLFPLRRLSTYMHVAVNFKGGRATLKSCGFETPRDLAIHVLLLGEHNDGSVQDCSNSSALAMELLQSWTEPSSQDNDYCCSIVANYYMYFRLVQTTCRYMRRISSVMTQHLILLYTTGT